MFKASHVTLMSRSDQKILTLWHTPCLLYICQRTLSLISGLVFLSGCGWWPDACGIILCDSGCVAPSLTLHTLLIGAQLCLEILH